MEKLQSNSNKEKLNASEKLKKIRMSIDAESNVDTANDVTLGWASQGKDITNSSLKGWASSPTS